MLDFLFVIFGGSYLGGKYLKDKRATERAKMAALDRRVSVEAWAVRHTDSKMEARLREIMDDPAYFQEIIKELRSAFAQMPSWSYREYGAVIRADQLPAKMAKASVTTRRDFILRERDLALDIMLANRGKVSTSAASFGYDVPNRALFSTSSFDRKDELARWIESTLRSQGVDVELTYRQNGAGDRTYVWVGSMAHRSTSKY